MIEIRHKQTRAVLLEVDADTLEGANLQGTNLAGAELFRANLFAARLDGANLEFANVVGADLHQAVLSGANLTRVNFYGADLTRADLRRADLTRALLSCADLQGALYDRHTRWPANFDVGKSRAILEGVPLDPAGLPSLRDAAEGEPTPADDGSPQPAARAPAPDAPPRALAADEAARQCQEDLRRVGRLLKEAGPDVLDPAARAALLQEIDALRELLATARA